jgi:hypothetical protein
LPINRKTSLVGDMEKKNRFHLAPIATLGFLLPIPAAHAVTLIYSESFSAADGTPLLGYSPETNNGVAGATFHESNNFWTANSPVGIFGNRAQLGADNQLSLPIDSSGGFTQPPIIRVSGLMNVGTTGGPTEAITTGEQRGAGMGFFAATGTVATPDNFRGLVITTDGRLILAQHGFGGSARAGFIEEITNGIDTSTDHNLSFDIDTLSGDISNINLNGEMQPDVDTTLFAADVNEVGFFASSNAGGTLATFDDFTVTGIPEPGSIVLLGLGGMLAVRRRRK